MNGERLGNIVSLFLSLSVTHSCRAARRFSGWRVVCRPDGLLVAAAAASLSRPSSISRDGRRQAELFYAFLGCCQRANKRVLNTSFASFNSLSRSGMAAAVLGEMGVRGCLEFLKST